MHVSEAINFFLQAAAQAGLAARSEQSPEAFGSSITSVVVGGAELRLVWEGRDEHLSVQVTHGPNGAPMAGWLTLYGSACSSTLLPEPRSHEESIHSAVEYGLELMSPSKRAPNNDA